MTTLTYLKGQLYTIPISDLQADPNQPRKSIDPLALDELVVSIKAHGIISPILFSVATDTSLIIVAGERRFRAAQQAGLLEVPGICVEGNTAEIALVENLLRQDLTAIEEAEALQRLKTEQQYSDEQLSGVIGKARTTISDIMLINRLPPEVRDECRGDRQISKNALIEIARKKQVRGMQTAFDRYKDKVAKAAAGRTKQAKSAETAADLVLWLDKVTKKLNSLDTAGWSEEEKGTFNQAVHDVHEALGAMLNSATPSNLA